MAEKRQTSVLNRLMHALDFDNDDLRANRDGYMSKRQRARLSRRRRNIGLIFITALVGAVVILLPLMRVLITRPQGLIAIVPILLIGGAATVALYLWFQRTVTAYAADLHKGHVSAIEGIVETRRHMAFTGRMFTTTYALYVNDEQFRIGMQVFVSLHPMHDEAYAVYYAPNSRTILAIEPLEDNMV